MHQDSAIELRDRWAEHLRSEKQIAIEEGAVPAEAPESREPQIAVGITGADGDYRLAIRIQEETLTPAIEERVGQMSEEANGEIDVRFIGLVKGLARIRPLLGGISIGSQVGDPGTLGCVVRKRGTQAPLFLLSNNHVLGRLNFAEPHEIVEQPAAPEQIAGEEPFEVAEFGETILLNPSSTGAPRNLVDAAIVQVLPGVSCDRRALFGTTARLAGQRTADLREDEPVFKVGKATNETTGTVTAWGISVLTVQLGSLLYDFDDQIEIAPDAPPFCAEGDSGSIVADSGNLAMGLLFCKSLLTERAYANPIGSVFEALDIELA